MCQARLATRHRVRRDLDGRVRRQALVGIRLDDDGAGEDQAEVAVDDHAATVADGGRDARLVEDTHLHDAEREVGIAGTGAGDGCLGGTSADPQAGRRQDRFGRARLGVGIGGLVG